MLTGDLHFLWSFFTIKQVAFRNDRLLRLLAVQSSLASRGLRTKASTPSVSICFFGDSRIPRGFGVCKACGSRAICAVEVRRRCDRENDSGASPAQLHIPNYMLARCHSQHDRRAYVSFCFVAGPGISRSLRIFQLA